MNRSFDKYPLFLFVIWLVFFFLPVGNRGLWDPDEPRYLQVAWEMAHAKQYLIPIFNGALYSHKPPLFFWLTILVSKLSSFETASRYVSVLMSLGTVCLTYLMGKRYSDKKTGFLAALILMTCGLYLWLTGTGNIDATLTFFTTLSFYGFLRYEENKKGYWICLVYISCGFGVLAKGPVGLLIPWLTFLVWTLYNRYKKNEKVRSFHLVWGPVLVLGIAALWVVPACLVGGKEYTELILIKQNVGRTVDSFAHQSPFYYYFINFPGIFAPWSVVFIGALFGLRKKLKESGRLFCFTGVWFITVFVFFTLLSGKRGLYLLPAYPAFGLFMAHVIMRWDRESVTSIFLKICIFLVFACGIVLFLIPPVIPILKNNLKLLTDVSFSITGWRMWAIYTIGVLPLIMLWMSHTKLKLKKNMEACVFFAMAILFFLGIVQISVIPNIDPSKSVKYFVNDIQDKISKDSTLAFFDDYSQSGWNFYFKRPVIPVVKPYEAAHLNPPYDFALTEDRFRAQSYMCLNDNPPKDRIDYYGYEVSFEKRIGGKEYTLWKLKDTP